MTSEQVDRQVYRRTRANTVTGCLEFIGHLNHAGYGKLRIAGRMALAHRVVWELERGSIPPQMKVCHRCDNPKCVLVDHLFLGTHADNMADMYAKGRGRKACGEGNGRAKLTWSDVRAIRKLHAEGVSGRDLARHYGISQSSMSSIVRGEHWKELA